MPVILKHNSKGAIASHGSVSQFSHADSNVGSRGNRLHSVNTLASAGSNLLDKVRKRSVQPTLRFSETIRNPKEWIKVFKRFYRRFYLKHLLPLIFIMFYMVLGALLFYWLESGAEEDRLDQRKRDYSRELELFVKRLDEIAIDRAASTRSIKRKFVQEAVNHFHKQLQIVPIGEPEWSLTTAMYFSGTIFTTIGFGDIACKTAVGRIFTVVYAIIGIPAMLMTLNGLGKFLYNSIQDLLSAYNRFLDRIVKRFKKKNEPPKDTVPDIEKGIQPSIHSTDQLEAPNHVTFNIHTAPDELTLDLEAGEDITSQRMESSVDTIEHPRPPSLLHKADTITSVGGVSGEETAVEELMPNTGPVPRMPVLVAICITVGWIFFCAALFMLWENWTYGESCYFMFIGMSTIGLGDLSVARRDLMVVCFVFVIIGLSLVSMCIQVIQESLEDLYKRLLMKMLTDYQAKLASGDHKGASMGMMKMWGGSKAAKYLMPMISSEAKKNVMQQIQQEAKETGIEIPPIFENIDEKTGMPKILVIAEAMAKEGDEIDQAVVNEIVKESDPTRQSMPSKILNVVTYDGVSQTEAVITEDKNYQTIGVQLDDLAIQTDTEVTPDLSDNSIQTDSISNSTEETQTTSLESRDDETMTGTVTFETNESQTEIISTTEQELQTRVIELNDIDSQTNAVETKNERIQTPYPEFNTVEVQTDAVESVDPLKAPSKISKARRRIQKAFKRSAETSKSAEQPEMSDWKEVSGDEQSDGEGREGSPESLDWDPIDGMHAERQRPVKDLKRMFDRARYSR